MTRRHQWQKLCTGQGEAYSHLPAFRSLGDVYFRYHTVINERIDKGIEGMPLGEWSAELTKPEVLNQQIVGFTGQMQLHMTLLQNLPGD